MQSCRAVRINQLVVSCLQLCEITGGSIRVINHAVAAREEEIDSFLAARAIGKTATIHTQQVALRRVRYFCVLTRIENHHAETAKNEENYGRRTRQNTHARRSTK
jgi:hypothetical protein